MVGWDEIAHRDLPKAWGLGPRAWGLGPGAWGMGSTGEGKKVQEGEGAGGGRGGRDA